MSKHAFNTAARFFVETTAKVQPEQWDDPGLGVWDVRELTGHAARALVTAEQYSAQRAEQAEIQTPAEYYHHALAAVGIDAQIAERGRKAGAELGHDPAAAVQAIAARAVPAVNNVPSGAIIAVPAGAMRLEDYLVTRVLELTVHTLDLANAIRVKVRPPRYALREALHLLADLALDSDYAGEMALVATGRGIVADRFSVLG